MVRAAARLARPPVNLDVRPRMPSYDASVSIAAPRESVWLIAEVGNKPVGLAWARIESTEPAVANLYRMWVSLFNVNTPAKIIVVDHLSGIQRSRHRSRPPIRGCRVGAARRCRGGRTGRNVRRHPGYAHVHKSRLRAVQPTSTFAPRCRNPWATYASRVPQPCRLTRHTCRSEPCGYA
jgi:hypothetical protein